MGKGRWVLPGAGAALGAVLLVAAGSPALQRPREDWGLAARAAAQRSILDGAPGGNGVEFADIEVRRNGHDDERWVCGSFAVRDEEGSLGPFRDFWVTVARVPETWDDIRTVRANEFGRDDFLDRASAHFRACFADDGAG
jgi:hypothetical protein